MKCLICLSTWDTAQGSVCPQCHFDAHAPDAHDATKILKMREEFKNKSSSYKPNTHVSRWDVTKPWISVVLGFIFFCFWLRACATQGKMF